MISFDVPFILVFGAVATGVVGLFARAVMNMVSIRDPQPDTPPADA